MWDWNQGLTGQTLFFFYWLFYYRSFYINTIPPSLHSDDSMQFSSSQPDLAAGGWEALLFISQNDGQVSFSQPTKPEHMLLGSQLLGTPGASQVIHTIFAKKNPQNI